MLQLQEVVTRIQMEYVEMPDMKLTFAQVRRLWNLPLDICEAALGVLVEREFLQRTEDGSFLRRSAYRAYGHVLSGVI